MNHLRLPDKLLLLLLILGFGQGHCLAGNSVRVNEIISLRITADLPAIRERKYLRALVAYGRTDFTILPNGKPHGLQVELLANFDKLINKGIKREVDKTDIVYVPTTQDRMLDDLLAGKGDIAAALLTATPERLKQVDFVTDGVMQVNEILVTHKSAGDIQGLDGLSGMTLHVLRNSHYVEHLRELNADFRARGLKPVRVVEMDSHLTSEDLLEMLNAGVIKATVVNDFVVKLWSRVLKDIRVSEHVVVKSGTQIGWAIRKNNPQLLHALEQFRKKVKKGTLLGNILFKRYFKNTKWITNPTAESEKSKFRRVIDIFDQYAEQYDFDVLAAVAQAYQESTLDNSKRSPRGAVGIMQVLPSTAADPNINIEGIEKLENNIHAGIKYLAFVRDRYFAAPEIKKEDKFAFSWAAYNAGPAKVRRMRQETQQLKLDPNVWFGNVEIAASRIVGNETVNYVRNIFKYYIAYQLIEENLREKQDKHGLPVQGSPVVQLMP